MSSSHSNWKPVLVVENVLIRRMQPGNPTICSQPPTDDSRDSNEFPQTPIGTSKTPEFPMHGSDRRAAGLLSRKPNRIETARGIPLDTILILFLLRCKLDAAIPPQCIQHKPTVKMTSTATCHRLRADCTSDGDISHSVWQPQLHAMLPKREILDFQPP